MVHIFDYKYKGNTLYFLWDIESGSLHQVNYVAFLYAKKRYNKFLSDEEIVYLDTQLSNFNLKNDVEAEFDYLEMSGSLNSAVKIKSFKKNFKNVKALCLHICHDCNLNCKYCFAGGGKYNSPNDYMSFEVGKKAIDFLIANSGEIKNIEVDFFGGEPLLNLQVVKQIVDYGNSMAKKHNKKIYYTMTTNCLALNKDNAEYLNNTMDNVVLSIDGKKETHNSVRHAINNKDCYDIIVNNAKYFRSIRGDKKYYVRATFTKNNLDFLEDIKFLVNDGFDQISMEPVVLPENHELAIGSENIDKILAQYDLLADYYIEQRKNGKWFNFFHYMIDLESGPCINKCLTACGAGIEYLAISPNGSIFPCHQFVGNNNYLIGNVFDGIVNNNLRQKFANNTVLEKDKCKTCPAKYYCGGGCSSNAYNFTGSINGIYELGCKLLIKRFENSLAIAAIEKLNYDL